MGLNRKQFDILSAFATAKDERTQHQLSPRYIFCREMLKIIVFSLAYGAIYMVSESVSAFLHISNLLTVGTISLYLLAILLSLHKQGKQRIYKIKYPTNWLQAVLLTVPLFLFPILNGLMFEADTADCIRNVAAFPTYAWIILSAFAEELLFHGILPVVIQEHYTQRGPLALFISNIIFALLHSSDADILSMTDCYFICAQILYAFGVGFSLAALTAKTDSLYPAVLIHILINLTVASEGVASLSTANIIILFTLSIAGSCYGLWILHYKPAKEDHKNEDVH